MDLYEILELKPNCKTSDIKKSYYRLAKIHHPDKKNGNTELFQKINYAYNILNTERTRIQYNTMNYTSKNNFTSFLEKWFSNNTSDFIFSDIDNYDFNDIILYFTNMIVPKKQFYDSVDCSDSDTECWDETHAEYYDSLPIKYHNYNKNNIYIELKCTTDDIISSNLRKIKIKRKMESCYINTSFNFYCNNQYIVYHNGGDIDINEGNLIIKLILPLNYNWENNNIIYNHDIDLYSFIYGINITSLDTLFIPIKNIKIEKWIPYRDGLLININKISNYDFIIKLNVVYDDMKENILKEHFTMKL